MKILIPEFESKKDCFEYLRKNATKIIAQKKALPTKSDDYEFGYSIIPARVNVNAKQENAPVQNEDELNIEVIGNVAGWCDSQMDVMLRDNWNKSILERGATNQKLVYHLKNHKYSTDAIVGKDVSLFTKEIDLSIFNIVSDIKIAQALLMNSTVVKDYDEKTFILYKDKQIKQHSIGLQYVKIYLCINSDDAYDAAYKENWEKYYPQVINKEKVDSKGYFWAVTEAKILEVSAVLFGANELTPVIDDNQKGNNTTNEPLNDTQEQPLKNTENDASKQMAICPSCNTFLSVSSTEQITCSGCGKYVSPLNQSAQCNWDGIAAAIN